MSTELGMLGGDQTEKQAEACNDEAESHDGEAAPDPREEGAFSCEKYARVGHYVCGLRRLVDPRLSGAARDALW